MDRATKQWDRIAKRFSIAQAVSDDVAKNKEIVKKRFRKFYNNEKVLDLGCGDGYYTDYFNSVGAKAIGIDGSKLMIKLANKKHPDTEFIIGDIKEKLPFERYEFDVVFSNQVLSNINPIDYTLYDCNRILKVDGILYFGIVHPIFYDNEWMMDKSTRYRYGKIIDKYITPYAKVHDNEGWGTTTHYHRPISYYLNSAAQNGFRLNQVYEPSTYIQSTKNQDIPLFFFAEFTKYKDIRRLKYDPIK